MIWWVRIVALLKKLMPTRRLKLIAMALLIILLWLLGFAAIATSPTVLRTLSAVTTNNSAAYMRLTNALIALICAAFVLWPRKGSRLVGRWNDYIGVAFLVFFGQYSMRFFEAMFELKFHPYENLLHTITLIVIYVGSYLNNTLFLAAARVMLNKSRRAVLKKRDLSDSRLGRLKNEWLEYRAALPRWIWIIAPVSLIAVWEERYPLWARFPDAIFSVYCLSWLAYSIWLSFLVRRKKVLAWMGLVLLLAYSAGQVIYATNPYLAYSLTRAVPESQPSKLVKIFREPKILADIKARAESPTYKTKNLSQEERLTVAAREFLDSAIIALLFPMKSLLFLPIFILYLLSIISVNDFRQALSDATSRRIDYLSSKGILRAIGRSMEAEEVDLLIRLPGLRKKQEFVRRFAWKVAPNAGNAKLPRTYLLKNDPLLKEVLQTHDGEIVITNEDTGSTSTKLMGKGIGPETLALVPIRFHGGAIGALKVIFKGYGKYNSGTLEQLQFMAELVGPSVQDFRTVFAVDRLIQRLIRELTARTVPRDGENHSRGTFETSTSKTVATLHDLLNPLGVCLLLESGFRSAHVIFPKDGFYHDLLGNLNFRYEEILKRLKSRHRKKVVIETEKGPVRIEIDQLSARTEDVGAYHFGTLILAIPHVKDDFARPTLAAYYLTRRMLASLTAQGIFNAARHALSSTIQELGVALSSESLSVGEWFRNIEEAVTKAGCLWVVAAAGDERWLLGRTENVEVIEGLSAADKENLIGKSLGCVPHHVEGLAHRHIIHIQLSKTGQRLWLGVERAEFGKELNFRSPWRSFLQNLASLGAAALNRIDERREAELQRQKDEIRKLREADDERMNTITDINQTVVHQLLNMGGIMRATAQDLLERLDENNLSQNGQTHNSLNNIISTAEMMMQLMNDYNKMIERDAQGLCIVGEAVKLAVNLYQFVLKRKLIEVVLDIPEWAVAKVPSHVISIAVASLIGNAVDAIKARGTITIKVTVEGPDVWCHIINDGPPIPAIILEHLFKFGGKGKEGHSGSGLYYLRKTLSHYGGEVYLKYSNEEKTCFTLRLARMVYESPSLI